MSWQATNAVTAHSKQKGSALLLMLMIANHADTTGGAAFMSVKTLAQETRMGDRNIRILLRKLEEDGELVRYGRHKKGMYIYGITLEGLAPREALFKGEIDPEGEENITGAENFASEKSDARAEKFDRGAERAIAAKRPLEQPIEKIRSPLTPLPGGVSDSIPPEPTGKSHPYWGFPEMSDGTYYAGLNGGRAVYFTTEELDDFAGVFEAHVKPGAYGSVSEWPDFGAEMPQDGEEGPIAVSPVLNGSSDGAAAKSKKRRSRDSDEEPEGFTDLWNDYPRHDAKADARKAYRQMGLDTDEGMRALAKIGIAERKLVDEKFAEGGRYCPYFATWLRGKRWEDEIAPPTSAIAYNFPPRMIEADRVIPEGSTDTERRAAEREQMYDALGVSASDQVRWRNLGDRLNRQIKRGLPKVWRESLFYPQQDTTPGVVIAADADAIAALKATPADTRRTVEQEAAKEWDRAIPQPFRYFTRAELAALRNGE